MIAKLGRYVPGWVCEYMLPFWVFMAMGWSYVVFNWPSSIWTWLGSPIIGLLGFVFMRLLLWHENESRLRLKNSLKLTGAAYVNAVVSEYIATTPIRPMEIQASPKDRRRDKDR